jgi:trigger factor
MSNIIREDHDALNATLSLIISPADYADTFDKEIEKYRKQAPVKGFRAGKTPSQLIRKMYGRQILADIVNKKVNEELDKYLEQTDIIGSPLPSESQEIFDLNPLASDTYTFKFEIGLQPQFELKGLDSSQPFDYYVPAVADAEVTETWDRFVQSHQTQEDAETIEEGDLIGFMLFEQSDEEDAEDGITAISSVLFADLAEEYQSKFLSKAVGDSVIVDNIFTFEKDRTPEQVKKYLLQLPEDHEGDINPCFRLSITKITRVKRPDINQELYDKVFGEGTVSNEAEAMARVREHLQNMHAGQSDSIFFDQVKSMLVEQNDLPLPEAFIKRWMLSSGKYQEEAEVERQYAAVIEDLRWSLMLSKLSAHFGVEVTAEDMRQAMEQDVIRMFGGSRPAWLTDDFIESFTQRMMKDEETVKKKVNEVHFFKLVTAMRNSLPLNKHIVPLEELNAKFDALVEKDKGSDDVYLDEE